MAGRTPEVQGKPWVIKPSNLFFYGGPAAEEAFLDGVAKTALSKGTDVEILDFTRAKNAGKDYWGPDISVLSLSEARERVSPEALERRIRVERLKIAEAEREIRRLEGIQTKLYGDPQLDKSITSS